MVKFLGINDEQTVCDCCGKTNLKKTVVMDVDGAVVRYGVNCAARTLKQTGKAIERTAGAAEYENKLTAAGYTREQIINAVWNRYGISLKN